MVMARYYGQMAQSMKEIGRLGELRAKENSFTSMVMCTKVNGGMTKPKATVPIIMRMGQSTKACGKTTCSTVKVKKHGLTVQNMMEIMN